MEEMLQICKKYGVPFGTTAANLEAAERYVQMGARFYETEDERTLITGGAAKLVEGYRVILA